MAAAHRRGDRCGYRAWRQARAMLKADHLRYLEHEWPRRWRAVAARIVTRHAQRGAEQCIPCLVAAHYWHRLGGEDALDDARTNASVEAVMLHADGVIRTLELYRPIREWLWLLSPLGSTWELTDSIELSIARVVAPMLGRLGVDHRLGDAARPVAAPLRAAAGVTLYDDTPAGPAPRLPALYRFGLVGMGAIAHQYAHPAAPPEDRPAALAAPHRPAALAAPPEDRPAALAAPVSMAGAPKGDCAVCLEAAPLATLVPCGHTRTCAACTAALPTANCPVCRAPIREVVRALL